MSETHLHKESILDSEEKGILSSIEAGEWKSVPHAAQEKKKAKTAATAYIQKDARINIRISSSDLARLKQRAAFEGLPYQTLISSILHKYSAGHLKNI